MNSISYVKRCVLRRALHNCQLLLLLLLLLPPDIDECSLENTCDKDAMCTNTDGGYECRCSPGGECSSACFVGGKKKKHGSSWDGDGCETCSCLVSGVALDGKGHSYELS